MITLATISHFEAHCILNAISAGSSLVETSLDLGLTKTVCAITPMGVTLPSGTLLSIETLQTICNDPNGCFVVKDDSCEAIREFSAELGRACSLYPTGTAPTMVIGGFPMHRIKGTSPLDSVHAMVKNLAPLHGKVLDTCTGLGYAAIALARYASHVTTIELDESAQQVARKNPWSHELFTHEKISRMTGSSFDEVDSFEDGAFAAVFHDPPTMKLAGELYSERFYQKVYRVLSSRGKMFHYIGDPQSTSGAKVTKGVIDRLKKAGFTKVIPKPIDFGVVASK